MAAKGFEEVEQFYQVESQPRKNRRAAKLIGVSR
jgi:hypothetical protein